MFHGYCIICDIISILYVCTDSDRRYASFRNILLHVIVTLSSFTEIFHKLKVELPFC